MYVFERKTSMSGQLPLKGLRRELGQAHSIPQHPVNFCYEGGRAAFDRLVATAAEIAALRSAGALG